MISDDTGRGLPRVVERAPEVAHFLAGSPGWVINYANWIIAGLVIGLTTSAALFTVPVQQTGRFTMAEGSEPAVVLASQEVETGRILVRNGEYVERGQVIGVGRSEGIAFDRMLYLEDILSAIDSTAPDSKLARLNVPANLSVGRLDQFINGFITAQSRYRISDGSQSTSGDLRRAHSAVVAQVADWKQRETSNAPISGIVSLAPAPDGGTYRKGEVIASILPGQGSNFLILAYFDQEIDNAIAVGQSVTLERDGYPAARFRIASATVTGINSPERNKIRVELRIAEEDSPTFQNRTEGSPPTTGTARITLGRRSLLASIFSGD